jgi:hypothetical protein
MTDPEDEAAFRIDRGGKALIFAVDQRSSAVRWESYFTTVTLDVRKSPRACTS